MSKTQSSTYANISLVGGMSIAMLMEFKKDLDPVCREDNVSILQGTKNKWHNMFAANSGRVQYAQGKRK